MQYSAKYSTCIPADFPIHSGAYPGNSQCMTDHYKRSNIIFTAGFQSWQSNTSSMVCIYMDIYPCTSIMAFPKETPYQGRHRAYGAFRCQRCNRTWNSSYSWANTGQQCMSCDDMVYPHMQRRLRMWVSDIGSSSNVFCSSRQWFQWQQKSSSRRLVWDVPEAWILLSRFMKLIHLTHWSLTSLMVLGAWWSCFEHVSLLTFCVHGHHAFKQWFLPSYIKWVSLFHNAVRFGTPV
jgi:hypothetical protein